jgi:hypothetical protein
VTEGLGSQKLYEDARDDHREAGELFVAERIDLPVPDPVEIPIVLPPTLDKLVNGTDTAPLEDDWLMRPVDDQPPKESRAAQKRQKREKRRSEKFKISVNRREFAAITLETAGMMVISTGFWLIHPWCGLVVLGLCLILIGVAISRGRDNT